MRAGNDRRRASLPSWVFAFLLAVFAATGGASRAAAQVSPGPLAAPHRALEGPLQCFQCHAKSRGSAGLDPQCLACHGEVAWMKARHRGLHGSAAVAAKSCTVCHKDHGGRDFSMILWDGGSPERFDHRRAGWTLEGKHATLACAKCHTREFQKSPALAATKAKRTKTGWIGLESSCQSCHADPHRAQLGTDCLKCHDQEKWKPAGGFDHAKTAYPLTGAHSKTECAACHATPAVSPGKDAKGQPIPQWKPLKHADCSACHKDPHAGRFAGSCASCHQTSSFTQIARGAFDHDKTRYPLRGAHAAVACDKCHDPRKPNTQKPAFARCDDCHRDAHNGTATLGGKAVDCAACHDLKAFAPSTYTAAQHQKSAYPLLGRHAAAACASCHVKRAADATLGSAHVALRQEHAACVACHADPHDGRFRPAGARPRSRDCLACHDYDAYRPSLYDEAMHADSGFPLDGAHRAVACQECHAELKAAPSRSSLRGAILAKMTFAQPQHACADCHADVHRGQFAARRDHGSCDKCHDTAAFVPATKFDHTRDSSFSLEGGHQRVPCARCHGQVRDAEGTLYVRYKPTQASCRSCHA